MRSLTGINRVRPPPDQRVDRPEVEAPQGVQLTGTNRPRTYHTHQHPRVALRPLCGSEPTNQPPAGRMTGSQCYGGHGERETPGHIPNPEAKPLSADGTALETGWESRTPPGNPLTERAPATRLGPFRKPRPARFIAIKRASAPAGLLRRGPDVVGQPGVERAQFSP